jgi:hypothetical protein
LRENHTLTRCLVCQFEYFFPIIFLCHLMYIDETICYCLDMDGCICFWVMHFRPRALVYIKSLVMLHNYASNFEEISWIDMCNAILMKEGRAFRLSTFECYSCVLWDLLLVEVVSSCPVSANQCGL